MVRRGSTVRVRQRALKSPEIRIFVARIGTAEHLLGREGVSSLLGVPRLANRSNNALSFALWGLRGDASRWG
jgi:hypothetical protein